MRIVLVAFALVLAACASPTQFRGDAKVKGGPAGCRQICASWDMELVGMVAMGDYSNGCICQVPGAGGTTGAAGASAAAAGVFMQMRAQRQSIPQTHTSPAVAAPR